MILKVAFLDVFHGDGAVITFDENDKTRCIVVDGGEVTEAAFRLNAWLRHQGVRHIDLLVATHIDSDHINGLVNLLQQYSAAAGDWNGGHAPCIGTYWGPLPDPDRVGRSPTVAPAAGAGGFSLLSVPEVAFIAESVEQNQTLNKLVAQRIANPMQMHYPSLADLPDTGLFDSVEIDFLSPDQQVPDTEVEGKALAWQSALDLDEGAAGAGTGASLPQTVEELEALVRANAVRVAAIADRDANNQSIVFRLRPRSGAGSGWSFLFSGDAQQDAWGMMLGRHPAERLRARVLKVPHHGSHLNGITAEAVAAIAPEYLVISTGQKHGLPEAETLNLLQGGSPRKLFCTERNNSLAKPGACRAKAACPRRTKQDFRSLLFEVDTVTGEAQTHLFSVGPHAGKVSWLAGVIWCPETHW
jgi:hypothetical protein